MVKVTMQSDKSPRVYTPQELVDLFPHSPLLTSYSTPWQNIKMAYMRQPAYEMPEVCTTIHNILIYTNPHSAERTIDGITMKESVAPGNIAIIPANLSHRRCWKDNLEIIAIGLEPSLFAHLLDDATVSTATELVPQFATPDPLTYQVGLSLKTVFEQTPIGSRLYAETTATMLAVHLLQYYGRRKPEFKDYTDGLPQFALRQVADYIQANLDRDLGLAELAAIAHLSPHYFARLFKRSMGLTPHQFVLRCRIERAKTLLLNGKDTIADIAQQVGFANQAHLSVHVKRLLGVTPKTIRSQGKNW